MGSLQQIFLGAICVGGAFLMGHFLNHQTPPSSPFEKKSPTEDAAKGTDNLLQQRETMAMLPNFRTQSKLGQVFGKEQDLPPPSQLDGAPASPSAKSSNQLDLADQELDIEVPDFSDLAAQFKGTALELPALNAALAAAANSNSPDSAAEVSKLEDTGKSMSLPSFNDAMTSSTSSQELSPHVPAQDEVKVPNFRTTINPVEEQLRAERESAPQINPVINPVTESTETSFRPDDFAPRLKVDDAATSINPTNSSSESNLDLATTDLSEVSPFPQSNSVLDSDRSLPQSRHPNAVMSYSDPFPAEFGHRQAVGRPAATIDPPATIGSGLESTQSANPAQTAGLGQRDPAEIDKRLNESNSDQWSARNRQSDSEQPYNSGIESQGDLPAESTNSRIPFGLNEGEKVRLSRLSHPSSQSGDTQATRFKEYKTESGDTLTSISNKFYGKPEFYLDIYLANRNQLRNPASVPAGIILRLPVYE